MICKRGDTSEVNLKIAHFWSEILLRTTEQGREQHRNMADALRWGELHEHSERPQLLRIQDAGPERKSNTESNLHKGLLHAWYLLKCMWMGRNSRKSGTFQKCELNDLQILNRVGNYFSFLAARKESRQHSVWHAVVTQKGYIPLVGRTISRIKAILVHTSKYF